MGAIFGAVLFDGAPFPPEALRRMAGALAARREEHYAWSHFGPAGLGQAGPASLPPGGAHTPVVAVAAGRIDNGEQLSAKLGRGWKSVPELILAAYERWGEDCPHHLVGDFAFAVWNPVRLELFCARDPFGICPFYYAAGESGFVFASEAGPLLTWPDAAKRINEVRVAELITESFVDPEATIYENVLRLPPGQCLTAGAGGVRRWTYWRPGDVPDVRYRSSDDYAAAFRSLFTEAVRCRSDEGATGVALSGGLDSSAVLCALAQEPGARATAFSAVYPELPECDERPYIEAVLRQCGAESRLVQPTLFSPLAELHGAQLGLAEPLYWPTWCMEHALLSAAQQQDIRVLLTGHGGDHVLAKSTAGYYPDLVRTGRWLRALREARSGGDGALRYLWTDFLKPVARSAVPAGALRLKRGLAAMPNERLLRLTPAFAARTDYAERLRSAAAERERHERTARGYHAHLLSHPGTHFGLDVLDAVGARFSLRFSHPFWDRRLAEFCYGLPRRELIDRGATGMVLRRALSGALPPEVSRRRTKAYFNPAVVHTLRAHNRETFGMLMNELDLVADWIDVDALKQAHGRFFNDTGTSGSAGAHASRDAGFLIAAGTLMLWLKRCAPRR